MRDGAAVRVGLHVLALLVRHPVERARVDAGGQHAVHPHVHRPVLCVSIDWRLIRNHTMDGGRGVWVSFLANTITTTHARTLKASVSVSVFCAALARLKGAVSGQGTWGAREETITCSSIGETNEYL